MAETIDLNDKINGIIARKEIKKTIVPALKQYEPSTHEIFNKRKRPDKVITTDDGDGDVKVARIPIALQKIIVSRAASFLIGKPIQLVAPTSTPTDEKLLAMLQKTWEDNKLDFKLKKLAKIMMSETECALIWYAEDVEAEYWGELGNAGSTTRMRMKIINPKAGDKLYPEFDHMGDMVSFGRGYFVKGENNQKEEHFDLYTNEATYYMVRVNGKWVPIAEEGTVKNEIGKMPIIYFSQDAPEWADVQDAIERLETLISNFADTNDYFASPMIKVTGDVTGFAKKGQQGKLLRLTKGADAEYLTWNGAPEAIKLEIETLFDIIYSMTQTPNITFKEMKGVGAISGVALNTFFIDAQLKAKDKQEDTFGECIQRCINFLKAMMIEINDSVKASKNLAVYAEFGLFKIDNQTEDIQNLVNAAGGKPIMSAQTAMELNPLVTDTEEEAKRMKEEADAVNSLENSLIQ